MKTNYMSFRFRCFLLVSSTHWLAHSKIYARAARRAGSSRAGFVVAEATASIQISYTIRELYGRMYLVIISHKN